MWVQEIQPNSGRHFAEQAHHRVDTEPSPRHIGDLLKPVGWGAGSLELVFSFPVILDEDLGSFFLTTHTARIVCKWLEPLT